MHIFISYAKADSFSLATQLWEYLSQIDGVTVWMDKTLKAGHSWAAQIQTEIRHCDVMVVLISKDVNRDPDGEKGISFVINEIEFAQRLRKQIIPVLVEQAETPIQIVSLQHIDFLSNKNGNVESLAKEIALLAGIEDGIHTLGMTPPQSQFPIVRSKSYRRPILIIGLLILAAIVIAIVISNALSGRPTVKPTTNAVLQPSDTSPAAAFTSPTVAPGPTSTVTDAPTATVSVMLMPSLAQTSVSGIAHNTDWKPQYQTFDGVEMALVPAGCFMMGSADHTNGVPVSYEQCVDAFWIDRYEVTNKQYGSEGEFKGDNRPRDSVTWFEARDFCIGRGARLPTELEWEYAARGPSNLVFPWGNYFVDANVVYLGNSNSQSVDVGSHQANKSWVGAYDMSGNLWEWVSSIFQDYPYNANDGREENADSTDVRRVLRGGGWKSIEDYMRTANRGLAEPSIVHSDVGFRCVQSR